MDHVDPFSFLEIKPVELFPSKDTTTTTPTTNASFSLLSLESIDQKDDELVVFNSTIFTTATNKNLERSRSFCQSPLPFHYNSNVEDATVEVKNSINSINHLEVQNAKEGSMLNAEESSSSSSSSSSDSGSSYYSFSDLSWDGFEPYHPPLPSTATMRRSKRDKNILPWKDDEFITFFKEG